MTHLADGAPLVRLVGAELPGQLAGGLEGRKVDGLEDVAVQLAGLGRVKGQAEEDERVGQSLHSDADRTVAHVGAAAGLGGVVVDVDDAVEVVRHHGGDLQGGADRGKGGELAVACNLHDASTVCAFTFTFQKQSKEMTGT